MLISSAFLRKQLFRFRSILGELSLPAQRQGQNRLGQILAHTWRKKVTVSELVLSASLCDTSERTDTASQATPSLIGYNAVWVTPIKKTAADLPVPHRCVLLYLHGGGYVTGELPYVRGVASMLAGRHHLPVLAPVYRLAPEHPFPAALEDALAAYRYLLAQSYAPHEIILIGESAGGGLIYALCLKLKALGLPLPAGLISLSPWADLTHSGESIAQNKDTDPTLSLERLEFFADAYCQTDRTDHFCSPLRGDLSSMPPSLIIVGSDEILLSDALRLQEKLLAASSAVKLRIAPNMWHAYTLYPTSESEEDHMLIESFLKETFHGS